MMDEERLLIAADEERDTIREVNKLLAASEGTPALVSASGDKVQLSHSVHKVLIDAVRYLSKGIQVEIMPLHAHLSTQQAANLLNVSRPYLVELLERGDMPFHKVGKHRRVVAEDLIVYKDQRDSERREALQDVIEESEALGLYDAEDE